jgi:hypothetical protein
MEYAYVCEMFQNEIDAYDICNSWKFSYVYFIFKKGQGFVSVYVYVYNRGPGLLSLMYLMTEASKNELNHGLQRGIK